jgi:hypothetical protein
METVSLICKILAWLYIALIVIQFLHGLHFALTHHVKSYKFSIKGVPALLLIIAIITVCL